METKRPRRKWNREGKSEAVVDVLTHIMDGAPEVGQSCIEQDAYARRLFDDPDIGNVNVPDNVKIVFLPVDERTKADKGSIVLEVPSAGTPAAPKCMISQYLRYGNEVLAEGPGTWDKHGKPAAIRAVLSHLAENPAAAQFALANDAFARALFQDEKIGNTKVPTDVKVVFVPAGENESQEFGSIVLETPLPGAVPSRTRDNAPHPLLANVLCCYSLW
jgi:hypothetical protein